MTLCLKFKFKFKCHYRFHVFRLIQDKIAVAGVPMPQVLKGYHHSHTALNTDGSTRSVSLREYMKRHLKLHEQVCNTLITFALDYP